MRRVMGIDADRMVPPTVRSRAIRYQAFLVSVESTMGAHRNLIPWTAKAAAVTLAASATGMPRSCVAM